MLSSSVDYDPDPDPDLTLASWRLFPTALSGLFAGVEVLDGDFSVEDESACRASAKHL